VNLKTEIIDIIDEGIIAIDSQGYITIYNKMARDIFGITPVHGPGHPKGRNEKGDIVVIADNILGADDGGLKPKDLELIGIDPSGIDEGDAIIAIGQKGEPSGSGIFKNVGKDFTEGEFSLEKIINGVSIQVMTNFDSKLLRVRVGKQNFDYVYLWSAGHLVLIDEKTMEVKFYQTKGYTARGEDLKTILRGEPYRGKGIYGKVIEVENVHVSEIHPDSDIIRGLTEVAQGEERAVRGLESSINGIPVRCSIEPLNDGDTRVGALLKVTDITEIKALWNEREKALTTLESLEKKLETYHIQQEAFKNLIGNSEKMKTVVDIAKRAADTSSTVLLLGESGTGKGVFAEAIHRASPRRDNPFVYVNCASIPETLLESELFGHEKGAFTGAILEKKGKFELADGGTIFLDEIVELPLTLQAKLLHVLQNRSFTRVGGVRPIHVNIRIITATNRDLEIMVSQGRFREDLFYRINVISILLPPLRERKEDIYLLAKHMLPRIREKTGKSCMEISEDVLNIFFRYSWPGNIRELENILERAAIMANGEIILSSHLPGYLHKKQPTQPVGMVEVKTHGPLSDILREAELGAIKKALEISRGNRTRAMEILDMGKTNFYKKLKKYKDYLT
jgi:transcriptional regulator with PAS, ATPase and Fis domain